VKLHARTKTMLAWSLWLATFGGCAAGLIATLIMTRPLTTAVLAERALYALVFPLASGTIGLVLAVRRPANPNRLAVCRLRPDLGAGDPLGTTQRSGYSARSESWLRASGRGSPPAIIR
jgi:hypothetical protein